MTRPFDPIAFAKGCMRRSFKRTSGYYTTLEQAKVKVPRYKQDGRRHATDYAKYKCAHCEELFGQKEVEVDHIIPVAQTHNLDEYAQAMFLGETQVLCKPCHKAKTKIDNEETKLWKEKGEFMVRQYGRVVYAGMVDGLWYLLFRNRSEAIGYCEDHDLDDSELEKLDNGLWRLQTVFREDIVDHD